MRKKIPDESDWKQVRDMLFELPESSETFSERVQKMVTPTVSAKLQWLQAIPHIRLNSEV